MTDPIPTCGWSKREGDEIVPCGQPAIGVYQVYATPIGEFMAGRAVTPQALLVCRDHEPHEEAARAE